MLSPLTSTHVPSPRRCDIPIPSHAVACARTVRDTTPAVKTQEDGYLCDVNKSI